jgi:hypothetical protein
MRVDESRIPKGQKVKVRCPHCKEIGIIQDEPAVDKTPTLEEAAGVPSGEQEISPPAPRTVGPEVSEHTLPSDAFESFRFPSEREAPLLERSSSRIGFRTIAWILVSLAIVGFFALLVNIILSGPGR